MSSLQSESDRTTAKLLAQQEAKLISAKRPLLEALADISNKIGDQEKIIADNTAVILLQEEKLEDLNTKVSVLNDVLSTATSKLKEANERTTHSLDENRRQSDIKDLLESDVSSLETERDSLQKDLTDSEALKMRLIDDIQALEAEYAVNKDKNDKNIGLLDAQILEKSQNLELLQEKEYLIRKDLASWQKRLEDQDKNLRVRELKVQEGETKIVQNANLLNL